MHDAEDDAKDAFVRLLRDWVSFVHDSILPDRTARFRWVALNLFRARHRIREVRRRTKRRDVVPDEVPITVIDTAPTADQALSARSSWLSSAPHVRAAVACVVGALGPWRPRAGDRPQAATARCDDLHPDSVHQARFQGRAAAGRALGAVSDVAAAPRQVRWAADL